MRDDQMLDQNERLRDRRALMSQMDPAAPPTTGRMTSPGIQAPAPAGQSPEALDRFRQNLGAMGAAMGPSTTIAPGDNPSSSVFQSDNKNGRGYLEEATRAYAPTLQGIKDEGEREKAVEAYLNSLVPELQKRGVNVGGVKKEKMLIDGQWVDLYRDVTNGRGTGAAEAQYLVDDGGGGAAPGAGMPMAGASSTAGVQALLPTDDNFQQTLQQRLQAILGGPGATDRQALMQMIGR